MAELNAINKSRTERFIQYVPLIRELVSRDIKLQYRRSVLGYFWSLLNPLLMMLIQAAVFSMLFKQDIPNYPLYVIAGNALYNFFNASTTEGMYSILRNSTLIKKVYIPKYIFPISRVVSSMVTLFFNLGAILIVGIITGQPFCWTMLMIPFPILMMFVFCCGVALLLADVNVYFRDISHLYGVFTVGLMYMTPLFYPIEIIPKQILWLIKINPLYHYINIFRSMLMYESVGPTNSWIYGTVAAVVMLFLGWLAFHKGQKHFILNI